MVPSLPLYTHPVLSFPCFSSEMHVKALTETYCLTEFLIFNILVKSFVLSGPQIVVYRLQTGKYWELFVQPCIRQIAGLTRSHTFHIIYAVEVGCFTS